MMENIDLKFQKKQVKVFWWSQHKSVDKTKNFEKKVNRDSPYIYLRNPPVPPVLHHWIVQNNLSYGNTVMFWYLESNS